MNLFIPEVGTILKLEKDWKFTLTFDYQNEGVYQQIIREMFKVPLELRIYTKRYYEKDQSVLFHLTNTDYKDEAVIRETDFPKDCHLVQHNSLNGIKFTLPKGTELKIDRIYVRKGKSDYSSLTFNIVNTTHPFLVDKKGKKKGKLRFWATLDDVNQIQCELQQNP